MSSNIPQSENRLEEEQVVEPAEIEVPLEPNISWLTTKRQMKYLKMLRAEKIAEIEREYRKELHQAQMKNEKAKYKLITVKLKYYENKCKRSIEAI